MAGFDSIRAALLGWPALLWLAWWLGERWQPHGVPRVSVYVAVGLAGSAIGLAVGLDADSGGPALLAQLALSLVLFELGCRIHLGWFRRNPWVLLIGLLQSVVIFVAVLWALAAAGLGGQWRPLLAAVAVAASPASLLRVANDLRAAGQVTERVLHLAAIQCVVAVLLVKGVTGHWYLSEAGDWAQAALGSVYAVGISIALGVALAIVVAALLRGPFASPAAPTVGYALALVWLTVVSDALHLSPRVAAPTRFSAGSSSASSTSRAFSSCRACTAIWPSSSPCSGSTCTSVVARRTRRCFCCMRSTVTCRTSSRCRRRRRFFRGSIRCSTRRG
jgi:Kef-type K+ transport system membrane component KefB